MLTILTIFISISAAGFAFWFYNKRQVKNLADQIEDKNAVISAFRSHVEETTTPVSPVVETTQQTFQKRNSEKPSKNGGNKHRQNEQKKSSGQKVQSSQPSRTNSPSEKKNRPNKQRKPKTQQ